MNILQTGGSHLLFLWVAIKRKREKYFQKGKSNNNKKNEGKERKERKKERKKERPEPVVTRWEMN